MNTSRPLVLFNPPNHVGLGHVNRLMSIALALREAEKNVRSLFVIEGASHELLDAHDLPYVPLPSSHAMEDTDSWSEWHRQERRELRVELSRAIVKRLDPRLVVFDCFPSAGFIDAVLEEKRVCVLCLREMRDLRKYLDEYGGLLCHMDLVLLPHEEGTFEVPNSLKKQSVFVGPIVRPSTASPEDRSSCGERPRVIITGGGGGYPGTFRFYNLAMKAIEEMRRNSPATARLVAGPLFRDWASLQVVNGITITPFEPRLREVMANADVVISSVGYNTAAELGSIDVKTILVPAERLWDDQFARAERLARLDSQFEVFRGSSPMDLADSVRRTLGRRIENANRNLSEGATRAAEHLCRLLELSERSYQPSLH